MPEFMSHNRQIFIHVFAFDLHRDANKQTAPSESQEATCVEFLFLYFPDFFFSPHCAIPEEREKLIQSAHSGRIYRETLNDRRREGKKKKYPALHMIQ